jgi:hypothetical protein
LAFPPYLSFFGIVTAQGSGGKPDAGWNDRNRSTKAMSGKVESGFPSDIAQTQKPGGVIRFN